MAGEVLTGSELTLGLHKSGLQPNISLKQRPEQFLIGRMSAERTFLSQLKKKFEIIFSPGGSLLSANKSPPSKRGLRAFQIFLKKTPFFHG